MDHDYIPQITRPDIDIMLLHEAKTLMMLEGVIETPDIQAENDHRFAREGEVLPLLPHCF